MFRKLRLARPFKRLLWGCPWDEAPQQAVPLTQSASASATNSGPLSTRIVIGSARQAFT
ncbi:MAG: hypothetical protein AMXMBFR76_10840 [Pseudomonadota bacterium]